MEKEIHLLWKFLCYFSALKKEKITAQGWSFCSQETISKEQHIYNNGIHLIYNMAAVIHHLPLNKLYSQNCKTQRMNVIDFFIKFKSRQKLYETKRGCQFFLELNGKEKRTS